MELKVILKANLKKHKGSFIGILVLICIVALCLSSVLTVWTNSKSYVQEEMNRLGYGDITAWVSKVPNITQLNHEIAALDEIIDVGIQNLVFSEYQIGEEKSDSEGQLITHDPTNYDYKIFAQGLNDYEKENINIESGEIYVSPSLISMFDLQVGDEISFPIARNGVEKTFTVKGYFEDPFMGSSMIGMKSFLINEQDREEIKEIINGANADALAREGHMLHIFKNGNLSTGELNTVLNEQSSLSQYTEFVHSNSSILGFMLTLQNVFTGLLLAFVVILIIVSLIVLGHSISTMMDQDTKNIGILKAMGFSSGSIRKVQVIQYLIAVLSGMIIGILGAVLLTNYICKMTLSTTGMLVSSTLPIGLCTVAFVVILAVLILFVYGKTKGIKEITPINAIMGGNNNTNIKSAKKPQVVKKNLVLLLALRQLFSKKKMYISACVIAIMLVFFTSFVGRMDSWLGKNGEGMMEAFNPAPLDVGIQSVGDASAEEIKDVVLEYSGITDEYMLAMPSVTVNKIDYSANVISSPQRFHMLQGTTSTTADEVVLTEFVAADLNVKVGDAVIVSAGANSETYKVSGIYQCANDMGGNIGMSKEGYERIGEDDPSIWCMHYFLENPMVKAALMEDLESTYGGDVYIHENSWPGLQGILGAMQGVMLMMYVIVAVFIMVVTALTGNKILVAEQKDSGIFKAIGFTSNSLRITFALRFAMAALIGSVIGVLLSATLTNQLVAALLKSFGISNFYSNPEFAVIILPLIIVTVLFFAFAYIASGKIRKTALTKLITEHA